MRAQDYYKYCELLYYSLCTPSATTPPLAVRHRGTASVQTSLDRITELDAILSAFVVS